MFSAGIMRTTWAAILMGATMAAALADVTPSNASIPSSNFIYKFAYQGSMQQFTIFPAIANAVSDTSQVRAAAAIHVHLSSKH
jgi:hypothetical protein